MSLSITAVWPHGIIAASDRRLVSMSTGQIVTNRSTKMVLFGCEDAHGVISYTGIGADDAGLSPSFWLMEAQDLAKIFEGSFDGAVTYIASDLEKRLAKLRSSLGSAKARHTFIIGYWHDSQTSICRISNFESGGVILDKGQDAVIVEYFRASPGNEIRIMTSGGFVNNSELQAISRSIKEGEFDRTKALCGRTIRSKSFRAEAAKGVVGASSQWCFIGENRQDEVWYGHYVVGGNLAIEPPNLLRIGAKVMMNGGWFAHVGNSDSCVRDTYVGGDEATVMAETNRRSGVLGLTEVRCGICGVLVPQANRECEVCLGVATKMRSRAQRRFKR
ncbi:MAG: hypothetical protein ABL995_03660 [Bryobacteraceae bacterium]